MLDLHTHNCSILQTQQLVYSCIYLSRKLRKITLSCYVIDYNAQGGYIGYIYT